MAAPLPYPLEGLRVLDLSRVLSGPFAGRLLADLGADVVKLEPPEGDVSRLWGDVRHGLSGYYTQQNVGKRNICVDLKAPGGTDLVVRLAERADVMIQNFRPGVMAGLGLGWDVLSAANPRLVLLSISGFGQDGPDVRRQAYAAVVHAEGGVVARQAQLEEVPHTDLALSVGDTNASLHGVVGILAALWLRERTERGQHIDIGMLDAILGTDDYANFGLDGAPLEKINGEVWPATGGPVMVASPFKNTWHRLSTVAGVADPTPPGAVLEEKVRCRRGAAEAWFRSFPDRAALIAALEGAGLPWGEVRSPGQVFDAPSVTARDIATAVDDRGGGSRRVVRSPYRFSDAANGIRRGAPYRGEHNAEVLADWLGAADGEADGLADKGVLLAETRPT